MATPPVIESATVGSVNNTSTLTITYPTGISSGDVILLVIAMDGPDRISTVPTGFTEIANVNIASSSNLYAYYKIAGGSESGDLDITLDASERGEGTLIHITGADTGSPTVSAGANNSGTSIDFDSVTTSENNSLIFAAVMSDNGNNLATFPGGWSAQFDNDTLIGGTGTGTTALYIAEKEQTTAGASPTDTINFGSASDFATVTFSIEPPAASGITGAGAITQDNNGIISYGPMIDFNQHTVTGYGGSQDQGIYAIEDDGRTLYIDENAWKKVTLTSGDIAVTLKTRLAFDIKNDSEIELLGIGVDTDDSITNDSPFRNFQIGGTDTFANAHQDYNTYVTGSGWQHYDINIGFFLTAGNYSHATFFGDDDNDTVADARFRNVIFYEGNSGAAAITQDANTLTSAGTVFGGAITGTADITQEANSITSAGAIPLTGAGAITQDANTLTSAGTIASTIITGIAAITQASDTVAGAVTIEVTGASTNTQAGDALTASGAALINGVGDITQEANSITSGAQNVTHGAAAITQDANTLTSAGAIPLTGAGAITQASDTVTGAVTIEVTGASTNTQAGDALTATGAALINGVGDITQEANSITSGAQNVTHGAAAITQDANTLTSAGVIPLTGAGAITQDNSTSAATGVVKIVAVAGITQGDNTSSGTIKLLVTGTSATTQPGNTLLARGILRLLVVIPEYVFGRVFLNTTSTGRVLKSGPKQGMIIQANNLGAVNQQTSTGTGEVNKSNDLTIVIK